MDNTVKSEASVAVPLKGENKTTKKPANLKYQRDKDREIVRGIFRYYEVPGGNLAFMYRAYKEDPLKNMISSTGKYIPCHLALLNT